MPSFIELSLIALAMSFLYSYKRVLIALPVVVMAIAATYSDPYLGDWAYYLVNASFSAIVVALLQVPKQTLLNVHIQIINAVTVLAHAMGFIMYEIGYKPDVYNAIILSLGVIEFTRFLIITRTDSGEYGFSGGFNSIYRFVRFRILGGYR
jgi:hypothetical protein